MSLDKQQMVLISGIIGVVAALLTNFVGDCISVVFYANDAFYLVKRSILNIALFIFGGVFILSLWYFLHKDKIKRNGRKSKD